MSPESRRRWSGRYEREELRLVREVLSPSDVRWRSAQGSVSSPAIGQKQLGSARVFAAHQADPDLEPFIRETYALNQVSPYWRCAPRGLYGLVTLYRDEHLFSSSPIRRNGGAVPLEVRVRPPAQSYNKSGQRCSLSMPKGRGRDLFGGATRTVASVTRLRGRASSASDRRGWGPDAVRQHCRGRASQPIRRLSTNEHLVLGR